MGKRPVVSRLPKHGGKEKAWHAALGPIVTADEYSSAVTAFLKDVEDVLKGNGKMQNFSSALRRLLLSRYDPPLPLYWTFVAVEKSLWLDTKRSDPLEVGIHTLEFACRVSSSLNALCAGNASGRTALSTRASIVGLLYDVASVLSTTVGTLGEVQTDTKTVDGTGKKVRKLTRKLKESLKEVLSYTVLCYCKDSKAFSASRPAPPNVPLENFPDFLYPTFPLASKKIVKALRRESSSTKVLAETVFVEVVLLQLVVEVVHRRILLKKQKADSSVGQDEFVHNLKLLAVHSIRAAGSSSPSEMVMDLLHMKRLPVRDLLDAEEEILVRGVLFDAVLVDDMHMFTLFDEVDGDQKSYKSGLDHYSAIFMKKLSVARQAVAFYRSHAERFRLTTLFKAMTTWHFPPQLLKWLSQKKQGLPALALQSPQAVTHWLVNVAEKSVFAAILDTCVATWPSGLTSVRAAKLGEVLELENGDAHSEGAGEDLFFVDTAGETEAAIDSEADLNFTAAARKMKRESDKIKKKKKKNKNKQSTVLFDRHEQSSTGTKRSRMEIDDVHLTSSSGSDSEDSEEKASKSAKKKLKKSKREVVDVAAAGEEDDSYGGLASTHRPFREENSPPVMSGDFSNQQEEEMLEGIESPKDQVDMTLVEEEASLSATLMEEILGSRQPEDASGRMRAGFEKAMSTPVAAKSTLRVDGVVLGLPSPVVTKPSLPVDGVVLGEDDGAQDTTRPVVESSEPPIKNVGEHRSLLSQRTPTSDMAGTSARSEPKEKRDLTGTPTSRKKRSKGQTDPGLPPVAEVLLQPKEEVCEEAPLAIPAQMLDGGKGQDDPKVKTVDATDEISDSELLVSMQSPSRRKNTKLDTPRSVGRETTGEMLYQRRTRSGRVLGTLTPTRTRKANARRELVLDSSQE